MHSLAHTDTRWFMLTGRNKFNYCTDLINEHITFNYYGTHSISFAAAILLFSWVMSVIHWKRQSSVVTANIFVGSRWIRAMLRYGVGK